MTEPRPAVDAAIRILTAVTRNDSGAPPGEAQFVRSVVADAVSEVPAEEILVTLATLTASILTTLAGHTGNCPDELLQVLAETLQSGDR